MCYGYDNKYCEHFEAIKLIPNLLKKSGGIIILNIKLQPFSYSEHPNWQKRRNNFYQLSDCSNLNINYIETFYTSLFQS